MKNLIKVIIIIAAIMATVSIVSGTKAIYESQNPENLNITKPQNPPQNNDKKPSTNDTPTNNEQDSFIKNDNNKENFNNTNNSNNKFFTNQNTNKKPNNINPNLPSNPENPIIPEEPINPEEPVTPHPPSIPENPINPPVVPDDKELDDLVITSSMLENNTYKIANKNYNTITISSDILENSKITFENIKIKDSLILVKPDKYQLDIINTSIPYMTVENYSITPFSLRAKSLFNFNKTLPGPTVNFYNGSNVQNIAINSNIEINGENTVPNITVKEAKEVVLNIKSKNLVLDTSGIVNVNKSVENLVNHGSANINLNASINTLNNKNSSTIRISENNTITNFHNEGINTSVLGSGTLTNAAINATNTKIYTDVTNKPEVSENIDYFIRKEVDVNISDIKSPAQGTVVFTLSEPVKLSLNDISVICTAGKNISLFNLTTSDDITYTLTTSYYKNNSYAFYITLPNGNIISKSFSTEYENPTVTNVVTERISANNATLKLYGVDEGGTIYYIIEEASSREVLNASEILAKGKSASVKVGFNNISITGLEANKAYNLYYTIEGYFANVSSVAGPILISDTIKEVPESSYKIVYAKEEISNHFVFKLNRIPEKELTLKDFEINCPTDSSLTLTEANLYVSPDLLTYIIDIPDNYGHKDNEYIVKIQVSDTEKIEQPFEVHLNPPVITGAVDNVIRTSLETAQISFNSDKEGEVYYGIFDWNGGIYDYNSSTPIAKDVLTGLIPSTKQVLYKGSNTIEFALNNINVTKNTRFWALFIDTYGNYRVGFVDHYKIPDYIEQEPAPDSSLKIKDFKFTSHNFFEIEFTEEYLYNITADDIVVSVVNQGYLPAKLLFIIDNSIPKKVTIKIANHTLTPGLYNLAINVTDQNKKEVRISKEFEVK